VTRHVRKINTIQEKSSKNRNKNKNEGFFNIIKVFIIKISKLKLSKGGLKEYKKSSR